MARKQRFMSTEIIIVIIINITIILIFTWYPNEYDFIKLVTMKARA